MIEEEHLIAAASNPHDPSLIFGVLHTKGKLDNGSTGSEILNVGHAKRRRVPRISSPRLSTDVINAAFSNEFEAARLKLLELFVEWGMITAADYDNRPF